MKFSYPHVIENCIGEKIIILERRQEPDGDRLLAESFVTPGSGPVTHTHFFQEEGFTVISGRLGYQIAGQKEQYIYEGETIVFEAGVPHRFWNDGKDILHCKGWIKPANTFEFFITSIFAAQNKSGKAKPELFDAAYLLTRYSSEYTLNDLPPFVRKVVMPTVYAIGKLTGRYKHFKDAPLPIKN